MANYNLNFNRSLQIFPAPAISLLWDGKSLFLTCTGTSLLLGWVITFSLSLWSPSLLSHNLLASFCRRELIFPGFQENVCFPVSQDTGNLSHVVCFGRQGEMGMRIPSAAAHGNNVTFRNYLKGLNFIFQSHPEKCRFSLGKKKTSWGDLRLVSFINFDSRQMELSVQKS